MTSVSVTNINPVLFAVYSENEREFYTLCRRNVELLEVKESDIYNYDYPSKGRKDNY
jgi:hypothetical protein